MSDLKTIQTLWEVHRGSMYFRAVLLIVLLLCALYVSNAPHLEDQQYSSPWEQKSVYLPHKEAAKRLAASLLMSLVRPHAVWCLGLFHPAQTPSSLPPNPVLSKEGTGRLAPFCPVPATHQAWSCSPLHLPYASLLCQTRARGQNTDRYAPAR